MPIRAEKKGDREAVRAVNLAAFETPSEADLVDALRQQAQPLISLVAEENGEVVGHIMFSPVSQFGIDSEYDVPDEVFMAMELQADALNGKAGRVSYHPVFKNL